MAQNSVVIGTKFAGEISNERAHELGIAHWQLSREATQRIESLESNMRLASMQTGRILLF
jgi:hypothetical protein